MKRSLFKTKAEKKAFEQGKKCTQDYVAFCMKNYVYELNISGIAMLFKDIEEFSKGHDYIPNKKGITFREYAQYYYTEDWSKRTHQNIFLVSSFKKQRMQGKDDTVWYWHN